MKLSEKKKIQYSISFMVIISVLVFFLTLPLNKDADITFASDIQKVLDSYSEQKYTVQNPIHIENGITISAKFYSVTSLQNTELTVCIIRVMGIAGPVPMIFLYEDSLSTFIGVPGFETKDKNNTHGITDTQISYWESIITSVIDEHFELMESTQ